MTTAVSRLDGDWWCDIDGTHLTLFSQVEQVEEGAESEVLLSRVGQRGEVVGRGLESLFVRFPDHVVLSVSPGVVRLVPRGEGG